MERQTPLPWPMLINEIQVKTVLNRSGISRVDYAVNPYLGCGHGCIYCYASFMKRFSRHREPWGSFVDVKVNAPEALRRQLARPCRATVLLSSVTDPYQPLEARYELTRRCLEILGQHPEVTLTVLTKSDLALRDVALFKAAGNCTVMYTITTTRDDVAAIFEPQAPPPSRRLAALRRLAEEGCTTQLFFGPVLPYFSDSDEAIAELFQRAAEAGVSSTLVDKMNFYPSVKARVLSRLNGLSAPALGYVKEVLREEDAYAQLLRLRVSRWAQRFKLRCELVF